MADEALGKVAVRAAGHGVRRLSGGALARDLCAGAVASNVRAGDQKRCCGTALQGALRGAKVRTVFARQSTASFAAMTIIALSVLSGCARTHDVAVEIPFVATIDGHTFSCTSSSARITSDLRLYVHDVALVDAAGRSTPVQLSEDAVWQHRGVALLDFENASEQCTDGTAGTHTTLIGRIAAGDYRALQFVVGVPFDRNHADAAVADAPLNLGRMHWGWQGGYKFLRFEGVTDNAAFRFHLGSTGCEGTIGHITNCSRPNRVPVRLSGFVPGEHRVQIDLEKLLPTAAGEAQREQSHGCMSEPDDPRCGAPFAALGLHASSGTRAGEQSLFTVVPVADTAS
jgi:uncharacterized repeat protein (TIGR04052 family)